MAADTGSQLVLEFDPRPALGRDDFLVSECNAVAVDWVDRWPSWPDGITGLNLVGPRASGKSHLAAVWRLRSGAGLIDGPLQSPEAALEVLDQGASVVLDGYDETWPAEPLFHLYNMVIERRGRLVLCSRHPVARMPCRLPDLASRFATLASVAIARPDDGLLEGVLAKLFFDRQLSVEHRVVQYLVRRMDRSFAEAAELVSELDRASLARHRAITLALAREVLDARCR